jgi:hypothetical protein
MHAAKPVANRFTKPFNSVLFLQPSVQPGHPAIAHRAGYLETCRDLLDRKPKTNALHVARVKNMHAVPVHGAL